MFQDLVLQRCKLFKYYIPCNVQSVLGFCVTFWFWLVLHVGILTGMISKIWPPCPILGRTDWNDALTGA